MPARSSARPSCAGSFTPCPLLPHAASPEASSSAVHAAAIVFPGSDIGARILLGATLVSRPARACRIHTRGGSEAGLLDDSAWTVALDDRQLHVLLRERGSEEEPGGSAEAVRVRSRQPVVLEVVIGPGRTAAQVRHEVEDLLARGGDVDGDGDLAH